MKSVNYALRKAYNASLNGLTANSVAVPVYYNEAPEGETSAAYVTFNEVSSNDISTKLTSDTNTSMQVQIHTWADDGNAGKIADDIADDVYTAILPAPNAKLDLSADGFQNVGITLSGDRPGNNVTLGRRAFVTRIITFNHNIFHQ